jgi:hypothetical protein
LLKEFILFFKLQEKAKGKNPDFFDPPLLTGSYVTNIHNNKGKVMEEVIYIQDASPHSGSTEWHDVGK